MWFLLKRRCDLVRVASVSIQADTPYAGWPATIVVSFNHAISGTTNFTISTDGPLSIASQQQLPANQTSVSLPATCQRTLADALATVTVSCYDPVTQVTSSASASITVHPISVSSVTFSAASVKKGSTLTATVHVSHALYGGNDVHVGGNGTQYPHSYETIPPMSSNVDIPITAAGIGTCDFTASWWYVYLIGSATGTYGRIT